MNRQIPRTVYRDASGNLTTEKTETVAYINGAVVSDEIYQSINFAAPAPVETTDPEAEAPATNGDSEVPIREPRKRARIENREQRKAREAREAEEEKARKAEEKAAAKAAKEAEEKAAKEAEANEHKANAVHVGKAKTDSDEAQEPASQGEPK